MSTILLLVLVLLLVGALPAWPYSRGWGYYPSGDSGSWSLCCWCCFLPAGCEGWGGLGVVDPYLLTGRRHEGERVLPALLFLVRPAGRTH
jgi:hypothetical protein